VGPVRQPLQDSELGVVPSQRDPDARTPPTPDRSPPAPGRYKAEAGPEPAPSGRRDGRRRQPRRRDDPRRRYQRQRSSGPLGHHGPAPVVGVAVTGTALVAAFDLALTGRLSQFFDLCFVLAGLAPALVVRRQGLFAVGVLPPLLLGGVVAVVAALAPQALTTSHLAFVSTWLTGLAHHGAALVATHLLVLAVIGLRAGPQRTR
jgi:hypothetical protein